MIGFFWFVECLFLYNRLIYSLKLLNLCYCLLYYEFIYGVKFEINKC